MPSDRGLDGALLKIETCPTGEPFWMQLKQRSMTPAGSSISMSTCDAGNVERQAKHWCVCAGRRFGAAGAMSRLAPAASDSGLNAVCSMYNPAAIATWIDSAGLSGRIHALAARSYSSISPSQYGSPARRGGAYNTDSSSLVMPESTSALDMALMRKDSMLPETVKISHGVQQELSTQC